MYSGKFNSAADLEPTSQLASCAFRPGCLHCEDPAPGSGQGRRCGLLIGYEIHPPTQTPCHEQ